MTQRTPRTQGQVSFEFFNHRRVTAQSYAGDRHSSLDSRGNETTQNAVNVINYFHAKAYINSTPIQFSVLQKRILETVDATGLREHIENELEMM